MESFSKKTHTERSNLRKNNFLGQVFGFWFIMAVGEFVYFNLRLRLVAVKRFPENTYFPEILISGKGKCFHVFGCISKNFPENIFWCLKKKKENTNQKTQATSHNPEKKKIINSRNVFSPTTAP